MSPKRILTEDEKKRLREEQMEIERSAYPGHTIRVIVKDETDDAGKPIIHVEKFKTTEIPTG